MRYCLQRATASGAILDQSLGDGDSSVLRARLKERGCITLSCGRIIVTTVVVIGIDASGGSLPGMDALFRANFRQPYVTMHLFTPQSAVVRSLPLPPKTPEERVPTTSMAPATPLREASCVSRARCVFYARSMS